MVNTPPQSADYDAWTVSARSVAFEGELARRGITLRLQGKELVGPCPRCGGDDRFAVNTAKQIFNCRGCGAKGDVIDLVMFLDGCDFHAARVTLAGEPPPKPNGKDPAAEAKKIVTARFDYSDEAGNLLFQVERVEFQNADGSFVLKDGKRKKTFRQRRPDPECPGWIWNIDGVAAVPYRLAELIEAIDNGNFVVIVEGEAKVDLLRDWNVPATCCAGGANKWRAEHSGFFGGADVVIVPDNDAHGREHADIVAQSLQGIAKRVRVLELPGLAPKGDVIDWSRVEGNTVEALHYLIDWQAKDWTAPIADTKQTDDAAPDDYGTTRAMPGNGVAKRRFKIEMLDEITLTDDPVELIQGLLPMGPALGVVFGPPKALKSFLVTNAGLHIAAGREYYGRAVQGGAVAYVTCEGTTGVKRRCVAARQAMGIEGRKVAFFAIYTMPNLGAGSGDRAALQQAISEALAERKVTAPLRLIVIDTMRRAMPGKSENEQKDVSIVLDNCETLAAHFGCLVLLVHHSPRSTNDRGSGSNAVDAAADVMWSVIRPDKFKRCATATVVRYKDGEEGDTWEFELCPRPVKTDRDGNSIMSCSVMVTTEPERKIAAVKSSPLSPAQRRIFDILQTAITEAGVAGLAGDAAPRTIRAVTRDTLKAYAKTAGWWDDQDDKSSRTRFAARLNELAGKHAIGLTAAHVWPARTAP